MAATDQAIDGIKELLASRRFQPGDRLPKENRARVWRAVSGQRASEETLSEHDRIYEALIARDPELARAASATHVASVERWLRNHLATRTGDG
jgi:DNA-binding FadR family transcriptional regulator